MSKDNSHIGDDVLTFLEDKVPDTPETRRAAKQEAVRLALTDAMRRARRQTGLTQKDVAERLGVSQSWVSKLENANHDHQVESVVAYLDALGANLALRICTEDETIPVDIESTLVQGEPVHEAV